MPMWLHTIPEQPEPKPKPEPKASAGIAARAKAPSTEPLAGRLAIAEPFAGRPASSGQLPRDVKPFGPLLVAGACPEEHVGGPRRRQDHKERMKDALAHLRSLSSDDERVKALEQYDELKLSLANKLWSRSGAVPPGGGGGPK